MEKDQKNIKVVDIEDSDLHKKREGQKFLDSVFIKSSLPLAFSLNGWSDAAGNKVIPTIDTRIVLAWDIAEKAQKMRRLVK